MGRLHGGQTDTQLWVQHQESLPWAEQLPDPKHGPGPGETRVCVGEGWGVMAVPWSVVAVTSGVARTAGRARGRDPGLLPLAVQPAVPLAWLTIGRANHWQG